MAKKKAATKKSDKVGMTPARAAEIAAETEAALASARKSEADRVARVGAAGVKGTERKAVEVDANPGVSFKKVDEVNSIKKIAPSQSFSNLFNAYTKAYNKSYNRHGPMFERPFKRKLILNEAYFQNLITYIHNNPVHHAICEHPINYPWSSYITCISEQKTKLKRKEVIAIFEDVENFKIVHQLKNNEISDDFF